MDSNKSLETTFAEATSGGAIKSKNTSGGSSGSGSGGGGAVSQSVSAMRDELKSIFHMIDELAARPPQVVNIGAAGTNAQNITVIHDEKALKAISAKLDKLEGLIAQSDKSLSAANSVDREALEYYKSLCAELKVELSCKTVEVAHLKAMILGKSLPIRSETTNSAAAAAAPVPLPAGAVDQKRRADKAVAESAALSLENERLRKRVQELETALRADGGGSGKPTS